MPVLDASVWVSLCHRADRHHKSSTAWLEAALTDGVPLVAPSLLLVEVGAAIGRLTGDKAVAAAAVAAIVELGGLEIVPLTEERSRRAAEIAGSTGVRGADAVYLEVAAQRGDVLVTWDRQQLDRGTAAARVETP